MIITVPLSKGNQITVPSIMRKKLGLKPGESMAFDTDQQTYAKAETQEEKIKRIFAELEEMKIEREKHMTPEQRAFAKKTAGWTVSQYHEYFDNLPETKAYIKEKYGV